MTRSVALAVAAGLVLASCSSGKDGTSDAASASSSPSPTSTVSVPEAVTVTEPGSELSFGETAAVIFEPTQNRGSVLELTVKKATKGSVKDFSGFILDDYTKAATPYYVDVTVKNVGAGDVGGVPVPLWGVDADNTLLPAATFKSRFRLCPSEPLPKKFAAGASMDTCLVYLAPDHGTLDGVSFRPNQEFNPISWTGDVATPKPAPPKTSKKPARKRSGKRQ
ncbi:MAG TPA: hypothetical protein VFG63_06180 [Nocardioidaceae bacterium]|nr:hypothetical protein [Nocardioidaceae bacterium]